MTLYKALFVGTGKNWLYVYMNVQNKFIHIKVGVTIKERNANKTILLQLFLRDDVSGLVPAGEKTIYFPI